MCYKLVARSEVILPEWTWDFRLVVHTEPELQADGREVGCIISVRKAERRERKAYEKGSF
jgi:uncharacterized DUF497 family protein